MFADCIVTLLKVRTAQLCVLGVWLDFIQILTRYKRFIFICDQITWICYFLFFDNTLFNAGRLNDLSVTFVEFQFAFISGLTVQKNKMYHKNMDMQQQSFRQY